MDQESPYNKLTLIMPMLQQNNGMTLGPKLQKRVTWTLVNSDNQNQLSEVNSGGCDNLKSPSTIDGASLCQTESQDSICINEFEDMEQCPDYFENGYCGKGSECTFSHETRDLKEILGRRSGSRRQKLIYDFPEILLMDGFRRVNSFLQ